MPPQGHPTGFQGLIGARYLTRIQGAEPWQRAFLRIFDFPKFQDAVNCLFHADGWAPRMIPESVVMPRNGLCLAGLALFASAALATPALCDPSTLNVGSSIAFWD